MLPSAGELVAHFLRTNGYTETLKSFISESGSPPDIGAGSDGAVTIEKILQEKKTFDLSLNFEKLGVDDQNLSWTIAAPMNALPIDCLPSRSNPLHISVVNTLLPSESSTRQLVVVTTADRQLHLIDPLLPKANLVRSYTCFQDSPILDVVPFGKQYLLIGSMSGMLRLYDTAQDRIIAQRKDHAKYIVKIATYSSNGSLLVATAGWDAKVNLYRVGVEADSPHLDVPIATLTLPSIPETTWFIASPDEGDPILGVSRRDSSFLHFYQLDGRSPQALSYVGKQNLAPHSNAWIAFTPSDVQPCPTDPSVVAVATSSTPHMKCLIVKLLLPRAPNELGFTPDAEEPTSQASQARAELAIADREEAAILVNVSTMAPQTAYSTPRIVWRPDGSGVYVSSDDGVVRGLEAKSGKIMASLEAHEPGSKLRCLWAGNINVADVDGSTAIKPTEYLISGGFDQKLILWSTK